MRLRIWATALCVVSGPAVAEMTGNEFLSLHERNPLQAMYYIEGVLGGMQVIVEAHKLNSPNSLQPTPGIGCAPETATLGQYRDVALKELREHPERRHLKMQYIMYFAYNAAWPCPWTKYQK
mgnify:CR=1 FL=1